MTLVHFSLAFTAVYVLFMILVGVYMSNKGDGSAKDYFLAGGSVGWLPFSLTLFATWMSTFAFLGSPGFYYKLGLGWFVPHGFLVVASPFLLWFIGRHLWIRGAREGHTTPGDFFASAYQSEHVRVAAALVCLVALVPYCLIQLVGIGKVIDASTGGAVSYPMAVSTASIAILIYSILGGARAVIWTDAIQAFLFGGILLGGAIAVVWSIGSPLTTMSQVAELSPSNVNFDVSKLGTPISLLVMWGFGYLLTPHMWQRIYMTNSAESLSRGVIVGSVLAFFVVAIPSLIIGFMARGSGLVVQDTDTLMVTVFTEHGSWLLPLLLTGAVAAGMSTVDSQLLTASSIMVNDISGSRSKKVTATVGRLTVLVGIILLWAIAMSPARDGAIVTLASKGIGIALLLLVPLLGGLLLKAPSATSGFLSLVVGAGLLLALELGLFGGMLPFGFLPPIAAMFAQIFVFALVQLWQRNSNEASV